MHLTIDRAALADALKIVARAVPPRGTLPILACILLTAGEDGTLTVGATDLATSIVYGVPDAEVAQPGAVALPAGTFVAMVNAATGSHLSLEVSTKTWNASLVGGALKATIHGMSGKDFPVLPSPDQVSADALTLPVDALARLLSQTLYAASSDASREQLNTVHLSNGDGNLRAAGTDGYRLGMCYVPVGASLGESLLLPRVGVAHLSRVLDDCGAGDVAMAATENDVTFVVGDAPQRLVSLRRTNARFPDVAAIIPKSGRMTVRVEAAALVSALRPFHAFRKEVPAVHLTVVEGPKPHLHLRSDSTQAGEMEFDVPAHANKTSAEWTGDPVVMDLSYLIDALQRVDGEAELWLTSPTRPVRLGLAGHMDEALHVIMPMNKPR